MSFRYATKKVLSVVEGEGITENRLFFFAFAVGAAILRRVGCRLIFLPSTRLLLSLIQAEIQTHKVPISYCRGAEGSRCKMTCEPPWIHLRSFGLTAP